MRILITVLVLGCVVGCTSPRLGFEAEGNVKISLTKDATGYKASTEGSVEAGVQSIGTTLYCNASGSGSLKVWRTYYTTDDRNGTRTLRTLIYLETSVSGDVAWKIDFSSGIPVPSRASFDEVTAIIGLPGVK